MVMKTMTVRQVAEYFAVTPRTIQTWLVEEDESKRLTGYKIGNRWRFDEADLEDFKRRMREQSQPPKSRKAAS